MTRVFAICLATLSLALFACGGDGGSTKADASAPEEAGAEAGTALTGLGQKCGNGLPVCPANASECVGLVMDGGTYCTPKCVEGGSGMSDANGVLPLAGITPPPNTGTCMAAYTAGAAGGPTCNLILALTPSHNPVMPNTSYTNITLGCMLTCTDNMCPSGFTCMASAGFCFPDK